jgi:ferric-dicitrate binding protein FerR (iron transport regulator)
MEENKRLQYLLDRYVTGAHTPAEEAELMQVLSSGAQDEWVKEYMAQAWNRLPADQLLNDAAAEKIRLSVLSHEAKIVLLRPASGKRKLVWAAAAILFLLTGSMLFYTYQHSFRRQHTLAVQSQSVSGSMQDVAPGGDGAVLTLADGTTIVLDSSSDGSLVKQGNVNIIKKDGKIKYVSQNGKVALPAGYNTIGTARGRQYQLVLEDGTRVWLNAASSIRYPVSFSDTVREVEITGEAYFDVATDKKKPFRVKVNGTAVEVLGTQFNINAYSDETAIRTTLLEGAVRVRKGSNQQLLLPGQQAKVDQKGSIYTCKNVNTTEVTAWKNNIFSFNNTDLNALMRQLARWYDVEVVFNEEGNSNLSFNGDISRTANLSTVLKMLELTGEVHFTIKDKTIMVNR